MRLLTRVLRLVRGQDWWNYKMPPMLSAAYAAILVAHPEPVRALATLVALLLSISFVGAYGYLINDTFDIDGAIHEPASTPIAELPEGILVELRRVDEGDPERLRYIASIGSVRAPGARGGTEPFHGPITIEVEGRSHVIGHELGQVLRCVPPGEGRVSAAPSDRSRSWPAGAIRASSEPARVARTRSRSRGASPSGARRWPSPGRGTWWPWATWTRATGPPTSPAAPASATPC